MNVLIAALMIPYGVYVLIHRRDLSIKQAQFHVRWHQKHPFWSGGAWQTSERFWRVMTPVGGAWLVVGGLWILFFASFWPGKG